MQPSAARGALPTPPLTEVDSSLNPRAVFDIEPRNHTPEYTTPAALPTPTELEIAEGNLREAYGRDTRDRDGRLKSSLKAIARVMSRMGGARDWGEFGMQVAGVGGAALGGALRPQWDEEEKRVYDIGERTRHLDHVQRAENIRSQITAREALAERRQATEQHRATEAERRVILQQLRVLKTRPDATLIERARRVGILISDNYDPTKKEEAKAPRTITVLQPDGMTEVYYKWDPETSDFVEMTDGAGRPRVRRRVSPINPETGVSATTERRERATEARQQQRSDAEASLAARYEDLARKASEEADRLEREADRLQQVAWSAARAGAEHESDTRTEDIRELRKLTKEKRNEAESYRDRALRARTEAKKAAPAPKSDGPSMSEEERRFRAAAEARGLDPDEAVRRARAAGKWPPGRYAGMTFEMSAALRARFPPGMTDAQIRRTVEREGGRILR